VLCDVRCSLVGIPFEFHQLSLHCVAPVRYSGLPLSPHRRRRMLATVSLTCVLASPIGCLCEATLSEPLVWEKACATVGEFLCGAQRFPVAEDVLTIASGI
jgi:hypothetical protein